MRARLPLVFAALVLVGALACTLNPQPLPPDDEASSSSGGNTGATPGLGPDASARLDGGRQGDDGGFDAADADGSNDAADAAGDAADGD